LNICVSHEGHVKYSSSVIPVTGKKTFITTAICKMNKMEWYEDMFLAIFISPYTVCSTPSYISVTKWRLSKQIKP